MSLGVPELLCNSVTPVSIQEIAERTGCHTDEKIYKVLRTMAQWGIGEELIEKHFKANRAMELLRRDKGPSLGHMVGYYASDEVWAAMLAFPKAVKDGGDTAFELAHGMNLYDYMYRAEELEYSSPTKSEDMASDMGTKQRRSEFAHNYDRAMSMLSQMELDIGGGEGQFLSQILKLPGCEHIKGVLFDFPDVVERAKLFLAKENVPDHRVTLLKGDILDGIPKCKEVDTIIVKNLFVIFTEDEMVKVLENYRQVLAAHGKFIIVNSCNPEARDTEHNVTKTGLQLGFRGIHIMAMSKMGHFRTKSEWLNLIDRLCKKVAFRLNAVYETGDGPTLFELLTCE